jgi:hypothetical protein
MAMWAIDRRRRVSYVRSSGPRQGGVRQWWLAMRMKMKMKMKMVGRAGKQEYSQASMTLALRSSLPHSSV